MIRFVLVSPLVFAVPFAATAQANANAELNVGSFSVEPDTVGNAPTIAVDLLLVITPDNVRHYLMNRRITDLQGATVTASADSRTCPAVLVQMAKVESLPVPRFVAPDSTQKQTTGIMLHPTTYTLAMRGHESVSNTEARLELSAQSGSPLAHWTDETLRALEPCWSSPSS